MKAIYTVLKLKDEFTPGIKKAASSTEALALKAKTSDFHAKKLGQTMKNNLAKGAKFAAGAMVSLGTAAVATGSKLVQQTIEQADAVDKMSQKIGISRASYQELDFVTSQCGASIGNMKMGMKTLTKQMQSASEGSDASKSAFDALGVSIYDSNGKLRSQEDTMWDAFKALQGMSNQTEKAALANQLFGRAGTELMPMLNGASGSIEAMRKQARELGLVMGDDVVDAGVKLTDTIDQSKRALSAVAMRIGGQLIPYAQAAGDYLLGHLPQIESGAKKVADGFVTFGNGVKWVYDKSNILIPVLGGVASGIAAFKVISTVTSLISAWKAVTAAYAATQGIANMTMLACPLTWIVLGITAAVAAGVALWKNWDTVCKWASKLKEKMLKLISPIKSVVSWLGKVTGFSGKTVNVNVNKNNGGGETPPRKPKHATGTPYFAGGLTGFSEGGRAESAIFPSGTKIIPADKTQRGNGPGQTIVNITIQGNVVGNEEFVNNIGERVVREISLAWDNT